MSNDHSAEGNTVETGSPHNIHFAAYLLLSPRNLPIANENREPLLSVPDDRLLLPPIANHHERLAPIKPGMRVLVNLTPA